MKRKILLLSTLILSALPIALSAQMTYVPDDNFEQALIDLGYDTPPLNDSIPTKNIDTISYLVISDRNISDLTGIEDFKALDSLNCSRNRLTSMDFSNNTSLEWLWCSFNQLTSLNISNNQALKRLWFNSNYLTSLDLSKNINLIELVCNSNMLTSLDINYNSALERLWCPFNQLSYLDISKNPALTLLYCSNNNLTSLDVSKNNNLYEFDCSGNQLTSLELKNNLNLYKLYCSGNKLSSLDVSNNPVLSLIFCSSNQLTSLNVKNGINSEFFNYGNKCFDATNNPLLNCIQVDDSSFSANNSLWFKDSTAHYSENCNYTGVEDNKFENEAAAISPNPATDYIELSLPPRPPGEGWGEGVRIYNILGFEFTTPSLRDTPPYQGGEIVRVDVSHLSPGVYFLKIGGKIKKFVKY
jgi:hypothetical protein